MIILWSYTTILSILYHLAWNYHFHTPHINLISIQQLEKTHNHHLKSPAIHFIMQKKADQRILHDMLTSTLWFMKICAMLCGSSRMLWLKTYECNNNLTVLWWWLHCMQPNVYAWLHMTTTQTGTAVHTRDIEDDIANL